MRIVATAVSCLLLGACNEAFSGDTPFGSSFDRCLIKNAIRSSTDSARVLAQSICERHFTRETKGGEASLADSSLSIDMPPQQGPVMISSGITLNLRNTNPSVIARRIEISIEFHKTPRGADGKWAAGDVPNTLNWEFPANLEPDENGTFAGTFADGLLPSTYYEWHAAVTKVIPYS